MQWVLLPAEDLRITRGPIDLSNSSLVLVFFTHVTRMSAMGCANEWLLEQPACRTSRVALVDVPSLQPGMIYNTHAERAVVEGKNEEWVNWKMNEN